MLFQLTKVEETVAAIRCCRKITFNNIFFYNQQVKEDFECILIPKLKSIVDYNNIVLDINKYVKSEFAMIIQHDGHILNPDSWDKNFLNFDYIGHHGQG